MVNIYTYQFHLLFTNLRLPTNVSLDDRGYMYVKQGCSKKPKPRNRTANRANRTVFLVNRTGLKIRLTEPKNR